MDANEVRLVATASWANKYCGRLDEVLEDRWRDLTDRVRAGLDQLSWSELSFGPGDDFSQRVIEPAVKAWIERHVEPLIREATDEFRSTVQLEPNWKPGSPGCKILTEGELQVADALQASLLPGGVALGWGAVTAGLVTTTKLLIFSTVVVNWPLLVGGLLAGTVLSWCGIVSLSDLKRRLKGRFEAKIAGQLREGLVGQGIQQNGRLMPSLKSQLQTQIRGIAAEARKQLAGG